MNSNETKVRDLYRAIVADSGTDGTTRESAIHEVAAQIQPMIDSGQIKPDVYSWVKQLCITVDKKDGASVDGILGSIARGEDDLTTEGAQYLDQVATLGRGRRKSYRFLMIDDLDEMDELRHRNVRSVSRSYNKDWKPRYLGWRVILRRNLTIGDAVQAGDLPADDAALFGQAAS